MHIKRLLNGIEEVPNRQSQDYGQWSFYSIILQELRISSSKRKGMNLQNLEKVHLDCLCPKPHAVYLKALVLEESSVMQDTVVPCFPSGRRILRGEVLHTRAQTCNINSKNPGLLTTRIQKAFISRRERSYQKSLKNNFKKMLKFFSTTLAPPW